MIVERWRSARQAAGFGQKDATMYSQLFTHMQQFCMRMWAGVNSDSILTKPYMASSGFQI